MKCGTISRRLMNVEASSQNEKLETGEMETFKGIMLKFYKFVEKFKCLNIRQSPKMFAHTPKYTQIHMSTYNHTKTYCNQIALNER